jgi:hypothetical protein
MRDADRRLATLLASILHLVGNVAAPASPSQLASGAPPAPPAIEAPQPPRQTPLATPASPEVVAELEVAVARVRERFEARDSAGVLAYVSDQYRSGGFTKAALGQQLFALFVLYDQVRVPIRVDQVQMVDGTVWLFTTGEVSGYVPMLGWVTLLSWERQPEVARREGAVWRLFGFQD